MPSIPLTKTRFGFEGRKNPILLVVMKPSTLKIRGNSRRPRALVLPEEPKEQDLASVRSSESMQTLKPELLALNTTRYIALQQRKGKARALWCLLSPAACTGVQNSWVSADLVKTKAVHSTITNNSFSNITFVHLFMLLLWNGKDRKQQKRE